MENIFYNRHWLDVSPSQSKNEWRGGIKVCLVQQQNKKNSKIIEKLCSYLGKWILSAVQYGLLNSIQLQCR